MFVNYLYPDMLGHENYMEMRYVLDCIRNIKNFVMEDFFISENDPSINWNEVETKLPLHVYQGNVKVDILYPRSPFQNPPKKSNSIEMVIFGEGYTIPSSPIISDEYMKEFYTTIHDIYINHPNIFNFFKARAISYNDKKLLLAPAQFDDVLALIELHNLLYKSYEKIMEYLIPVGNSYLYFDTFKIDYFTRCMMEMARLFIKYQLFPSIDFIDLWIVFFNNMKNQFPEHEETIQKLLAECAVKKLTI